MDMGKYGYAQSLYRQAGAVNTGNEIQQTNSVPDDSGSNSDRKLQSSNSEREVQILNLEILDRIAESQSALQDYTGALQTIDKALSISAKLQTKNFRRKKHGGKGLGLAICKVIVEAHNGSIGVNDAADGGSEFWVVLLKQRSKSS